jgi:hypothetical protein
MTTRQLVLTDTSEELVMSIFTLDMVHDLANGGTSVITSDPLNSQLFVEICSFEFIEYEHAKGNGWCTI